MKVWRSLRTRLVASYMALALVLLAFSGYIFSNALAFYASIIQQQQMLAYRDQAQAVLAEGRSANRSPAETLVRLRQALPNLVVNESADLFFIKRLQPIDPFGALPLARPIFMRPAPKLGEDSFDLIYTVGGFPVTRFHFTLRAGAGIILSNLYEQVLTVLGLALGLAALIGLLLARWLARPLARLAAATEAVADGDFLQTVEPVGVTELDRLTEQFNRMVLRLRESFRSLAAERDLARRFAGDAAHELKTPVTTLRACHEVMEEHPERLSQVSPAIGRQIERMERVIAGLLELSRISEGTGIHCKPGDVTTLIRELEPVYQALAEEHGLRFTTVGLESALPVSLDRRLLEMAVGNLVDNACKYTPAGGQVSLLLQRDGTHAVIAVQDTGRGIPREELPYVFERFHRGVDTQSIPGTGLGLAIAEEAVRRLGGELTAESAPAEGSRFVIRLPLLKP